MGVTFKHQHARADVAAVIADPPGINMYIPMGRQPRTQLMTYQSVRGSGSNETVNRQAELSLMTTARIREQTGHGEAPISPDIIIYTWPAMCAMAVHDCLLQAGLGLSACVALSACPAVWPCCCCAFCEEHSVRQAP